MALTKLIYSDSNEALVEAARECGQQMFSVVDCDNGVKSASSALVSKSLLEKYRPSDHKTACIHLIAMGDSETYGFNRNGDAFPGRALQKYASTFVTNGHVFKEHANKDARKALGSIKWAGYDPSPTGMHRVELIIHLDKDKAEREYAMAKEGKALNFSMSCRVPHDRCSCCGNEASKVSDYCDCLKHGMGSWKEKYARYAFAYNDDPVFFDISIVKNPADRIARHLEYSFAKAASAQGRRPLGAELALEAGVNLAAFEPEELFAMRKLASAEEYIGGIDVASDNRAVACKTSYPLSMMEKFSSSELDAVRGVNPGTLFNMLAKKACVLSFPAFCQYLSGEAGAWKSPMAKRAAFMLPGIFGDMLSRIGGIVPVADQFAACSDSCAKCDGRYDEVQRLMDGIEDKFSMDKGKMGNRILSITISVGPAPIAVHGCPEKCAASGDALGLAEAYAQYQARALCDIDRLRGSGTAQDFIEPVAAANTAVDYGASAVAI